MNGWRHPELAAGRWWELTLAEQLGNVGSEVSRALRWRERNPALAQAALERALELLDLTLADPRHRARPGRLRELARAREVVADFFSAAPTWPGDSASLQRYFDAFALAARRTCQPVPSSPTTRSPSPTDERGRRRGRSRREWRS